MPDSFIGLVIFAVLAAPGLVFTSRKRRYKSDPTSSAFTELATIVMISLVSVTGTLAAFLAIDVWWGRFTPDVEAFVRGAADAFANDFRAWLGWGALLLGIATGGAWLAARTLYGNDARTVLKDKSYWEVAFRDLDVDGEAEDSGYVYLVVTLTDGSRLKGFLKDYDARFEATEERDLLLNWPVKHVTPDAQEQELEASYVWISARRISHIEVEYGKQQPTTDAPDDE